MLQWNNSRGIYCLIVLFLIPLTSAYGLSHTFFGQNFYEGECKNTTAISCSMFNGDDYACPNWGGCSNGNVCAGDIYSCSTFSYNYDCNEIAGCIWGECSGFPYSCDAIYDVSTCVGIGCSDSTSCSGDIWDCQYLTNEQECSLVSGCSWNVDACTGSSTDACTNYNNNYAACYARGGIGCYPSFSCTGSGSCSNANGNSPLCSNAGCSYYETCAGIPEGCSYQPHTSQSACEQTTNAAITGCNYTHVCTGTAATCQSLNQTSCNTYSYNESCIFDYCAFGGAQTTGLGNWYINSSRNCNITTDALVKNQTNQRGMVYIAGSGTISLQARIEFWKMIREGQSKINIKSGGRKVYAKQTI